MDVIHCIGLNVHNDATTSSVFTSLREQSELSRLSSLRPRCGEARHRRSFWLYSLLRSQLTGCIVLSSFGRRVDGHAADRTAP